MSNETGIRVTKPDETKKWQFDINKKELIKSSLKVGGSIIAKSDSFFDNLVDVGASIGLAKKPGELAWLLIVQSLTQAVDNLLKDYQKIYTQLITNNIAGSSQYWLDRLLIDKELTIYPSFFDNPIEALILKSNKSPLDTGKKTYFIEEVKTLFTEWLTRFNFNDKPLEIPLERISSRLCIKFRYALAQELKENSDKYTRLQKELNVPFLQDTEQERKKELAWHLYSVWLEDQVNQRIFDEAFTLKDVYVPLRAYYEREIKGKNDDDAERQITKDKRYEQIVVELESELTHWLNTADPKDAIRVISGGPGSGKSSFTKWFAAKLVKEERKHNVRVLFIPLHLFDLKADLVDEVSNFLESTTRSLSTRLGE